MTLSSDQAQREEHAGPGALDLHRFLPYRLSVLANRVSRALAAQYRDRFGLSIPEWRVLAVLGRDGRLSAVEIAARTSMDKVKVSRAIAALLRKRLVRRQRDPQDRRVTRIEPTAEGRRTYGAIACLALDWQARWLGGVGEADIGSLWRLLDLLEARLDGVGDQPSAGAAEPGGRARDDRGAAMPAEGEDVR